jgi:hypothetical protein
MDLNMSKEKNKRLLMVGYDSIGLLDIIRDGFNKYGSFHCESLNIRPLEKGFYYRSFQHRLSNLFLKNTTGINLKKVHFDLSVIDSIFQLQQRYDAIFILRPDLLKDHHLDLFRQKTNVMIALNLDLLFCLTSIS